MTRVFVAGGAGGVGEGIVRGWLGEGARVVTASRSPERRDLLAEQVRGMPGTLVVLEGSSSDPDLLAMALDDHGPFDHVVASVGGGGWQLAPLATIGAEMFGRVLNDGVTAHWRIARALLPTLPRSGSYVFINGGAAREVIPGTGPLSLVARAQLALADIFRAEIGEDGARTCSLILNSPIATRSRGTGTPSAWLTPDEVGRACVRYAKRGNTATEIVLSTRRQIDSL